MKFLGAATLVLVSNAAIAQGADIGLGPFKLGMAIEEAKSVPIVGIMSNDAPSLICSDVEGHPPEADVTEAERAEGVLDCHAGIPKLLEGKTYYGSDWIKFGAIYIDPTFRFLNGKLIEITATAPMVEIAPLRTALQRKYGPADRVANSTVSNTYGATWPQQTTTWMRDGQQILLIAPGIKRDFYLLTFSDKATVDALDKRIEARKANDVAI